MDGCSNICSLRQFCKKYLSFDLILLLIWRDNTIKSTASNKACKGQIPKLIMISGFFKVSLRIRFIGLFLAWSTHSLPLGNWSTESKQIIFNLPRPWATPHFLHISDISFVAKIPEVKIVNSIGSDPSAILIWLGLPCKILLYLMTIL